VLRMGNITKDGGLDYSNLVFTSDKNEIETYRLSPGAVIFNRTNSREWVGKTAYYDGSVPAIYAGYLIAFYPIQLLGEYVNYAMCSPYERDWCKRVKSDGINQSNINSQKLKSFLLPVPPLEEQKRIVSLLNETMPYVDQYSALEDARERLDAELPDRLRKSILQMAVQGKLVSQDPADEPASALLERIRAERAKLIKEKKLKAPKGGESVIYRASDGGYYEKRGRGEAQPIEVPFDIPESWEWARLSSLGDIVGGGTPKTHDNSLWADASDGIPWITPADMKNVKGKYVSHGDRYLSTQGLSNSSAQLMPSGTVVMSSRAPIGYLGIASCAIATNQGFKSIIPIVIETNEWILLALDALMGDIKRRASGTTFKEISGSEFGETLIPIPPLSEQMRIIACSESALDAVR